MKIKKIKLSRIFPYWRNPRKNDQTVADLQRAIKKYGFNVPLILDKDYVIISGHARYRALLLLEWEYAYAVVKDDLSEKQAREYRLIDNKTKEYTIWDEEMALLELKDIAPLCTPVEVEIKEVENKINAPETSKNAPEQTQITAICPHCLDEFQIDKNQII